MGFNSGFKGLNTEFHIGNNLIAGPAAARSKAYFCGLSPAKIVGSNPTGGIDVCLL